MLVTEIFVEFPRKNLHLVFVRFPDIIFYLCTLIESCQSAADFICDRNFMECVDGRRCTSL